MKKTNLKLILFLLFIALFATVETQAQRRVVVRRPSKTVVVTRVPRSRVVYVNRPAPYRRNVVVRALAPARLRLVHRGVTLYYHAGIYYRTHANGYVVVVPPPGFVIPVLPVNYARVALTWGTFFYFNGVFYQEVDDGYKVVKAPEGAIIKTLPEDASKVTIDGKIFYEHNGTLYKKVETEDGFAYEVSGEITE